MQWSVLKSIFKRDFVSYFSNPTGYVFICVFVVLSSLATFWPPDFFSSNLANLDQLSRWLPFIMLVFIPAITMSIWAEEKRQGTDELLLTLPADDFDIVIGKYMAAAAIFTASLLFSQISTFTTLAILTQGTLDTGLIFTTYLTFSGVWLLTVIAFFAGEPAFGAALFVLYWLGRALSIWITPLLMPAASATPQVMDAIGEQYRLFQCIHVVGLAWAVIVLCSLITYGTLF